MTKLSDRFIKKECQVVEPVVGFVETDDLLDKLLCKINSVPVWHEFTKEEQENLALKFLVKNSKVLDKSLIVNVVGLGIIHPLLENENVSEILIDEGQSVKIVISNNICDTEIYLSELQMVYLKNCAKSFKDITYKDEKFEASFILDSRIVIKKV